MSRQAAPQRSRTLDYETPPILRASGLRKTFRMGDASLTVLKHADLTIRPGEFVAIEGRSGSGKSTLLHLLGALDTADEGSLQFEGRDYTRHNDAGTAAWVRILGGRAVFWTAVALSVIGLGFWLGYRFSAPSEDTLLQLKAGMLAGAELTKATAARARSLMFAWTALIVCALMALLWAAHLLAQSIKLVNYLLRDRVAARVRNRDFGFVFQFYHLLPELNVVENTMLSQMIQFSWRGFMKRRSGVRARATEVLEQLGMGHRLHHRPNQLSGGERQRVAIARALMNNPRVLFADEPTGNLDAETGLQIMAVLEKLHQEQGQTIVMVTHDRTLAHRADRVLVMKDGKLERAEG
jgi:ABC-type lipoprotein export system ATPase subunit